MAAVSKNVYFDVLDDISNKNNNAVYRTIKTKPIDVTSDSYAEYKAFLLKDTLKIDQKKFFLLAKLKTQFRGHSN